MLNPVKATNVAAMSGRALFAQCMADELAKRNFGHQRKAEILEHFERRIDEYARQGLRHPDDVLAAMSDTMAEMAYQTKERAKRTAHDLQVMAANNDRILQGLDDSVKSGVGGAFWGGSKGKGVNLARAAISLLDSDPRFSGVNLEGVRVATRNKYYALLDDALDKFGKGAFGRQRGKASMGAIEDEVFGKASGNAAAKAFADAYRKLQQFMIDDFNASGGSIRVLKNFILPQRQNSAKLKKAGKTQWIDDHMGWLDWGAMRWPNGEVIAEADRKGVLATVYDTLRTDGKSDITPGMGGGQGRAVGDMTKNHRFLIYKGVDEWRAQHAAYGDGNVMDVIFGHIESMANRAALVKMFGNNPQLTKKNIRNMVAKAASEVGDEVNAVTEAEPILKKFDDMFDLLTNQNPLNPESVTGSAVVATSHLLTSAQLGSVPLIAVASDFMQSIVVRGFNNMPLVSWMSEYFKGMTYAYRDFERRSAQIGFIYDELTAGTYATERYNALSTIAPAWSRNLSSGIMRLSGNTRHTNVARLVPQQEMMALLHNTRNVKFDAHDFKEVMSRYGITEDDWNAVRMNAGAWSPNGKAEFLRPLDILDTKLANRDKLYDKFSSMIYQESLYMVPGSTAEASVTLRGNTRADTLPGALLHSFGMYKNFPLTIFNMYGRLAMSKPSAGSRLGFLAAVGAGSLITGAVGVQLREIAKGREPLDMNTGVFWGKAALSGGALSIYGDFLFSGIQGGTDAGGLATALAGPLAGLATDITSLAIDMPFRSIAAMEMGYKYKTNFASRAVEFMRRNTPGTSLWYARLALEREVWDTLADIADPRGAARKRNMRIRNQKRYFGNEYWWAPGEGLVNGR